MLRSDAHSYAIGNLREGATMDVHEVDANGWAWGFVYGEVNRCAWAQFHVKKDGVSTENFEGPIDDHVDQCGPKTPLPQAEWTTGEINAKPDKGTPVPINGCPSPHYWDNWDFAAGAGIGQPRGSVTAGQQVSWRYVTKDGKGVMANMGEGEWYFFLRECFDELPP
ncbi:hypothetical protein NAEX_01599 [Nannocystis exedens]|nr:hypothetical protein NAEX_01599 [Nannocystis exedens]